MTIKNRYTRAELTQEIILNRFLAGARCSLCNAWSCGGCCIKHDVSCPLADDTVIAVTLPVILLYFIKEIVTLEVGVEVPDDVDLDTSDGYDKALELAAQDVATRGESEIRDAIIDVVSEDH